MNKLFVISGSSGVGKGTVIRQFLKTNVKIKLSISTTTRKPRSQDEIHGLNYFFTTKEDFQRSVDKNEFLEWAEYSGNYYGTKKNFVDGTLKGGFSVLLEIDTQGALQIKEKMPEAVLIFIAPPNKEELRRRLIGRGTENEKDIQERLSIVEREQENSKYYDYIVVNDVVDDAVAKIEEIFNKEIAD